ncbi:MAG: CBS domain-containing protein [Rhodospirillales bacterium]|nr:CBS domain-containing protein [Rhodospirillales bacterium]
MTRTIADIMATELVTFHPDLNIHQAIHTLLEKRISGAPVVDDAGKLVGILSRKDCLRIAFSSRYHDGWGGQVRDYMVTEVKTLDASLDIIAAVQLFLDASFRRFPVMRDGELVGLVSRHDILTALSKDL